MNKSEVLNLREFFGDRYKITFDPAAEPRTALRRDPEYFVIPAKFGEFYPHDERTIAFWCNSKRIARRILRELGEAVIPHVGVYEDGEIADECILLFPVEVFEAVAKIAKARRRRQISEIRRLQLSELSKKYSPFASINAGSSDRDTSTTLFKGSGKD